MSEQILKTCADGVCELRFNRPEKRNAITFAMYQAFNHALCQAQADGAVRAVLLSGEGANFSAGNDLQDFLTGPGLSTGHPALELLRTLATFDKPLVAAVHGQTVGIGVTLLLHCDVIVAAPCRSWLWGWCPRRVAHCSCRGWWASSAPRSCCCSASRSMPPAPTAAAS